MDPLIEQYLESISRNLYRIANSLEELIDKPKEPETKPTTTENNDEIAS